jgi:hypothetical protein
LGADGKNAQPPRIFWDTNVFPGDFAVSTMASLFASPKEGAPTFVDSLNDSGREELSGHGIGKHGGENGVDKDQTASNGQASASPPRETHVTFLTDGGEVGGPGLIGRERGSPW